MALTKTSMQRRLCFNKIVSCIGYWCFVEEATKPVNQMLFEAALSVAYVKLRMLQYRATDNTLLQKVWSITKKTILLVYLSKGFLVLC